MNEWSKRTAYSIQSGAYIICRTLHGVSIGPPKPVYTLWARTERIGTFRTADAAKVAADAHIPGDIGEE